MDSDGNPLEDVDPDRMSADEFRVLARLELDALREFCETGEAWLAAREALWNAPGQAMWGSPLGPLAARMIELDELRARFGNADWLRR